MSLQVTLKSLESLAAPMNRYMANLLAVRQPYKVMSGGIHRDIQLPHTDEVELYHYCGSSASQKVRLALAQRQIAFKSHHVGLTPITDALHNQSAEYSLINPTRTVPVLVHRGHPIFESSDIVTYIDANIEGNACSLSPVDAMDTDIDTERWTDCASMYGDVFDLENLRKRAGNCIPGITMPALMKRAQKGTFAQTLELSLVSQRGFALPWAMKLFGSRLLKSAKLREFQETAHFYMRQHLQHLNAQLLVTGAFIAGNEISTVDFGWIVVIERCRMMGVLDDAFVVNGKVLEGVKAYWARVCEEECYKVGIAEVEGYAELVEANRR